MNNQKLVTIKDGKSITTSKLVAQYFNKRHSYVLFRIEQLEYSPSFTSANFIANEELIQVGTVKRKSKYYEITKDGLVFLLMSFTGQKASLFKIEYIEAFNMMEQKLNNHYKQLEKILLKYSQCKKIASGSGRSLATWKTEKRILEQVIHHLTSYLQPDLFNGLDNESNN